MPSTRMRQAPSSSREGSARFSYAIHPMKKDYPIVLRVVTTISLLVGVVAVGSSQGGRRGQRGDRGPALPNEPIGSALPQVVEAPSDNPTSPAKVALGKLLFWDPILSGNKDDACSTCHHPDFGYAENLDTSIGVNGIGLGRARRFAFPNSIPFVKRNSQSLLNTAFNGIDQQGHYSPSTAPMFWDVRVQSLEAQAVVPVKTLEEMRGNGYSRSKLSKGLWQG